MKYSNAGAQRLLTEQQVEHVLKLKAQESSYEIGARFGVSGSTIQRIIRSGGKHYKRAPPAEARR